ncbi:TadE/TadG family type IV pilus assembly protein [Defluviimonas sp. SAOS-178_SWC]|uniref:TadE/TadG family type IV pilus assembly protein n=1 Tax=Defluviimonas sp. SAOS-178_SWC TaxID=3121287 RepID=UPI0032217493
MRCLHFHFGRLFRFGRAEDGAATVEAVLWLPMYVMLIALLADVSMMFHGQSRLLRIAQDANRNMSIGRLTSTTETENFVLARANELSPHSLAATSLTAGMITTTVSVPLVDLDLFGVAGIFSGARMTVRAEHLMEN